MPRHWRLPACHDWVSVMPSAVPEESVDRGRAGSGDSRRDMRTAQRLAVLVVTAMVPATVVLAVRHSGASPPPGSPATSPVLVGTVSLSTTNPAPGVAIVATVTLRADRALRLDGLRVAVRDEWGRSADAAGRSYDFPDVGTVELSTVQQKRTFSHQYRVPGGYAYFLQYRSGGAWHDLAPYESFRVG